MEFGAIIIGDEILSGRRTDRHLSKLIEHLAARGLSLAYAQYVGDDPDRITATLARAFASGDVVFSFGGIGATPDDHTRQCAARALGVEMALHPQAAALIRERMQDVAREQGVSYDPDRADNIHRLNMGVFPVGADIIPNPYNKIAGFYCASQRRGSDRDEVRERGGVLSEAGPSQVAKAPLGGSDRDEVRERGGVLSEAGPSQVAKAPLGGSDRDEVRERGGVYFLPGFPVMAHPMVEWVLDNHYRHLFNQRAWIEQSVIVFGAMEATLTPLMQALEQRYPIKVFSLPSVDHPQWGRHIDLGVKGDPAEVDAAFSMLLQELRNLGLKLGPEIVRK